MQQKNRNANQRTQTHTVIPRTTLAKVNNESDLLDVCMYHYWKLHPNDSKRKQFAAALGVSEQRLSQYLTRAKMDGLDWLKIERLMKQRVHREWLDIQWENA